MDHRHKLFVIVGSIALLASSGMGGAYLFAAPDKIIEPEVGQVVTKKVQSSSSSTPSSQPVATQVTTNRQQSQTQPPSISTPAPTTPITPSTTTQPSTPPTTPSAPTYAYRDGQYTVSLRYSNGHGKYNTITTALTVEKDIVSTASVSQVTGDPESQSYFDSFQSKFSPYVINKALLGLSPSRIGGASLTTAAFDSTLHSIRTAAGS